MMRYLLSAILLFGCVVTGSGQRTWTLEQCIEYALENSNSLRQSHISLQEQEISLRMSKNERLPSVTSSLNDYVYFGRGPSRDGTYTDNTKIYSSLNVSMSVPVFNGMRINNNIKYQKLNLLAFLEDMEQLKQDISINVTSAYMQVLFSRELLEIANRQLETSLELLDRTRLLETVERATRANIAESESLVARDRMNVIQADNNLKMAVLELAQILNLNETDGFTILLPDFDEEKIIYTLPSVQTIFNTVLNINPTIRAMNLRLNAGRYNISSSKASYYPTISLSAGYSNGYYYYYQEGIINAPFREQFKNNGSEFVGVLVSVPIFNKFSVRNQVRLAKIDVQRRKIMLTESENVLLKEIERAYQSAISSHQKFLAAKESSKTAGIVLQFEEEKYTIGRSTIYNYNDAKNQYINSESEMLQSKYEMLFRVKILELYMGRKVNLDYNKSDSFN